MGGRVRGGALPMIDTITTEKRGRLPSDRARSRSEAERVRSPHARAVRGGLRRARARRRLRCAVVFAHGDHFTGGLDLASVAPAMQEGQVGLGGDGIDPWSIYGKPRTKPVVVAVQGLCLTLGIELCLASDITVASETARFAQIEIKRGIFPFGGATFRLVQTAGWGNAMRWLLTGDEFGAEEAHRIGLVQEVTPKGRARARHSDCRNHRLAQAPLGVYATLASARRGLNEEAAARGAHARAPARPHDLERRRARGDDVLPRAEATKRSSPGSEPSSAARLIRPDVARPLRLPYSRRPILGTGTGMSLNERPNPDELPPQGRGGGASRPAREAHHLLLPGRPPASARLTPCWRRRAASSRAGEARCTRHRDRRNAWTLATTRAPSCSAWRLSRAGRSSTGTSRSGEFDLDAALARRPALLLVDELAHTNAEGSRHAKRWQDVEEILDAGIDVYTTLNVQHLESLNDVVAQVTGVIVRETVPDSVVEQASEVHLVDLPPDQLLERLREGKVYLPDQAARAADHFFRKGNLSALRELALRQTAERVDADMRTWRTAHGIDRTWATTERLLVGLSPSPASSHLVRSARRMAGSLHAPWIALYVETPGSIRLSAADRDQLAQNLRLAQQLGAEVVTLTGESAAIETVRYASKRNVTKIVVGKPTHARWKDLLGPSFLDIVVRSSGDADVYVISGDVPKLARSDTRERVPTLHEPWRAYAASGFVIAAATALSWRLFGWQELADVVMVQLLGIVVVSMRFGYGPSIFAAVLAVLSFDFFFIPPYFTFAVTDLRHILTFAIMFLVALVISGLTKRIRAQADAVRERENRTTSLYAMSRELAGAASTTALFVVAVRHVADVFGGKVAILMPGPDGSLESAAGGDLTFVPGEKERGVAEWVWTHDRSAGWSTDTLPSAAAFFAPLRAGKARVGVVGILPVGPDELRRPEPGRAPRHVHDPDRRRHRARDSDRGSAARAHPGGNRAAPQLAPQLGVARPPDAARCHHRVGRDADRARARRQHARRAPADDPGRGRAPEPPRPQPPRHDARRGRRSPGEEGVAGPRGGRWCRVEPTRAETRRQSGRGGPPRGLAHGAV